MKFIKSDIIGYKTKTNSINDSDSKYCNETHQFVGLLFYIGDAEQYYSRTAVSPSRRYSSQLPL